MTYEWFSMTRTIGLAAYATAMLACLVHWARLRRAGKSPSIFGGLAGVELILLLDMAFDWRWKLHDFGMRQAIADGAYGNRRTPQVVLLVVLFAVLASGVGLTANRLRKRPGAAIAASGTLASVGSWCCEAVSYHDLDRLLYFHVGKTMLVALLWVGLSGITCMGVWLDWRSYRLG
jgi:hypothetical protein